VTARVFHTTTVHAVHAGAPDHEHGPNCGHRSVKHAGQHVDYLVGGHAHHAHEGHWDECDPYELEPRSR
jgi:hypothetical protein